MSLLKRLFLLSIFALVPSFAQAAHSVTLTWTWAPAAGSDPATGFHVWRASSATAAPVQIATINDPTILTYTDTSVAGGQTWIYSVTAFNPGGDAAPSNQLTCVVTFLAPTGTATVSATVK